MPILSPARAQVPLLKGLTLLHRGKVRDSYALDEGYMLVYATDAVSIFDILLNALIPQKGMVLTAMNHFCLTKLEKELGIKTHLIAAGSSIDKFLPEHLRRDPELQARAIVVRRLKMIPVEFIARGFLTGSGLSSYLKTSSVCGRTLSPGFQDGDGLKVPLFTPTTKANEGHDVPLDAEEVRKKYPEESRLLLKIYSHLLEFTWQNCNIILADTKVEFGHDAAGKVILADEVGTPDCCRYWDAREWEKGRTVSRRKAPAPLDKQIIRDWGIQQGINELNPLFSEHAERAQRLEVPTKLIKEMTETYHYLPWRLTKKNLETYQREELGINLPMSH